MIIFIANLFDILCCIVLGLMMTGNEVSIFPAVRVVFFILYGISLFGHLFSLTVFSLISLKFKKIQNDNSIFDSYLKIRDRDIDIGTVQYMKYSFIVFTTTITGNTSMAVLLILNCIFHEINRKKLKDFKNKIIGESQ